MTYLYATEAVAAWLSWHLGGWRTQGRALGMFVLPWGLNALWTPLLFGLHRPGLALIDLLLLWLALAVTLVAFWRGRRASGVLLLPSPTRVLIETALNCSIWRLHPGRMRMIPDFFRDRVWLGFNPIGISGLSPILAVNGAGDSFSLKSNSVVQLT